MERKYLFSFFVGLVFLLIVGCVSEFDFRTNTSALPGISGVISNSPDQRTLFVFETDGINENLPVSATGALYADGNLAVQLVEESPGQLKIPIDYQLKSGVSYYFEITTSQNRTFQTIPQKILPFTKQQTLSWERSVESIPDIRNPDRIVPPTNVVNIYTNLEIDQSDDSVYFYRWQMSDTWLFREIPRPFVDTFVVIDSERAITGPGTWKWVYDTSIVYTPDTAKDCYPTREIDEYASVLLETSNLDQGTATIKMMSREIDQSFLFKHYFSVFLHRIDAATYDYYAKAERLISNQGSLYDEVPAPLTGNVFDKNNPEAPVLGYIEMSFPDTMRVAIEKDDLNMVIEDECRPRGNGTIACKEITSPGGGEPQPCKCYDCDKVFGEETDVKPPFWK